VRTARLAIILTAIGLLLCLWLFVGVAWYNFAAFMMLAQPLLVLSLLIFVVAVAREIRRRGML
jgi:uncharacterized protein (DUF486 family)